MVTAQLKKDTQCCMLMSVIFGAIMTLPQLFYALDMGWGHYFDIAPDQSFYLMNLTGDGSIWNERPINKLNAVIWFVTAQNAPVYFIISTWLFSVFSFMGAWFLVRAFSVRRIYMVLFIPLILFPTELLSFNYGLGPFQNMTVHSYLAELPLESRRFFSDNYMTYLSLQRLPEPATTMWVFLFFAGFIMRAVLYKPTQPLKFKIGTIFFGALLSQGYVFLAVSGVILAGCVFIAETLDDRKIRLRFSFYVCLINFVLLTIGVLITHRSEAGAVMYSSHLPIFSVSYLWSALLLSFVWFFRRCFTSNLYFYFTILLTVVPIIIMNQQVFTGLMIQAVNWERYINYYYIVLAMLIIFQRPAERFTKFFQKNDRLEKNISYTITAAYLVLLVHLQIVSYAAYWTYNVGSQAIVSALNDVYRNTISLPKRVVLNNMGVDQSVRPRLEGLQLSIKGYASAVKSITDKTNKQQLKILGFEYAFYSGFDKATFLKTLKQEIEIGVCWPHTMYYFDFLSCAPYVSDFHMYNPEKLMTDIDKLSQEYDAFVKSRACSLDSVVFVNSKLESTATGENRSYHKAVPNYQYSYDSFFHPYTQTYVVSVDKIEASELKACNVDDAL
jgi:hypothetical protein